MHEITEDPSIYRAILENMATGVCLVDREYKIVFWNVGAEKITGFLRQDVLGRPCGGGLFAGSHAAREDTTMDGADPISAALRDGKSSTANTSFHHKSGHQIPVRIAAVPIRNNKGMVIGAAESFDEGFTAANRSNRYSIRAEHGILDQETGIACSGFIELQLEEQVALYAKYPVPFSILCIQVDGLEDLRHSLGAEAALVILRAVAQTLENCIRPNDSLGRTSDDHFLAILAECSETRIAAVANRLCESVRHEEIRWWGKAISVSVSLGGAAIRPGDEPASLVERARRSLQQSMERGGNQCTVLE
jgi:diguanylate cyclase (GGDEF)-like protein/PAS domain S-box-containing protein